MRARVRGGDMGAWAAEHARALKMKRGARRELSGASDLARSSREDGEPDPKPLLGDPKHAHPKLRRNSKPFTAIVAHKRKSLGRQKAKVHGYLGAACMYVLITAPSPPHRYVGSRSLEPTPRALGARARERIELPATMMDETTLRAKLQPYAERRHLHFGSLRPAGFSVRLSAARRDPFDETIRHLGGGFCCVEAERRGGFGHFW